ncbi:MarR family winged helix-turn-helix transcriptional regulator [Nocardioides mangrovi]|uniref:MarR family transcriptional regulator n=1 Tax=Nocardioides mangrovi TaxID=2874580 RepID=A0ABS7U7F1_9ACTN|nr:MarR family transcriptional regulator [Nocardioides mangrovi]MBZ5736909.1 MarR family transcriptional regulator [Nocardioides mangrovi]
MVEAHPRAEHSSDAIAAMRDLSMAGERLRHALARRGHLSPTDLHVMEQLLPGPVGYSDLARRTGVTRSAISNIANRLIRSGLARRRLGVGDRRRVFLELTERGRDQTSSTLGPVFAVLGALDQSVTPAERQVIERYLRDATRAYEAVEALVSHSPHGWEQH